MKKTIKYLALSSTLLTTYISNASEDITETESNTSFQLIGGITYGGDKLGSLIFDDGDKENIRAGSLVYLGAGINQAIADTPYSLQVNFAYHFDTVTASNGDMTFSRFSLEAIPFYQFENDVRLGLGIIKPLSAELEIDFNRKESVDFDSDLGLVAELGWNTDDTSWFSIRYASIDYQVKGFSSAPDVDGSYIGMMYYWGF